MLLSAGPEKQSLVLLQAASLKAACMHQCNDMDLKHDHQNGEMTAK